MSERYWITGVQLGMLKVQSEYGSVDACHKLIDEIIDKQFIGQIQKGQRVEPVPKKVKL